MATDFSPASKAALPHALVLAGHYRSDVYVTHVIHLTSFIPWSSSPTRAMLQITLSRWQRNSTPS